MTKFSETVDWKMFHVKKASLSAKIAPPLYPPIPRKESSGLIRRALFFIGLATVVYLIYQSF